ncbi:MAG: hypothetical protein NTW96_03610 [Planctomycetia bacterium]|nr:hypothetical protein [Planctomycetia bacterium]
MTGSKRFPICDWRSLRGQDCRLLIVDSRHIDECMQYYRRANLAGLYISKAHGYALDDLRFLKDYPSVKRIVVAYASGIHVSELCAVPDLRSITIADNKQAIDFSVFPELEELSIDWHPKVTFPESSKALKSLTLRNYRPQSKDFTELPDFSNLQFLKVVRTPVNSLAGLRRFKKLVFLDLAYLSKLERIAGLDAYSLEELRFDVCRKITDHEHVATLPRLWKLILGDCGTVPSLKFLDRMSTLRWFSFVDTNVLDGDMTPCFRLEYAGTLNKKHYSHTSEEIKAIIAQREVKAKRKK